jgi:hypothetical protein
MCFLPQTETDGRQELKQRCAELKKDLGSEEADHEATMVEQMDLQAKVVTLEDLGDASNRELRFSKTNLRLAKDELGNARQILRKAHSDLFKMDRETDEMVLQRTSMLVALRLSIDAETTAASRSEEQERQRSVQLTRVIDSVRCIVIPSPADSRAAAYTIVGREFGVGFSTRLDRSVIQQTLQAAKIENMLDSLVGIGDVPMHRHLRADPSWVSPRRRPKRDDTSWVSPRRPRHRGGRQARTHDDPHC